MFNFKRLLDFVVIQDKNTKKIIYPNESMKKAMYRRYKYMKKFLNKENKL